MQENLLLDENSNIKLIDFGLAAEPQVSTHSIVYESIKIFSKIMSLYVPPTNGIALFRPYCIGEVPVDCLVTL